MNSTTVYLLCTRKPDDAITLFISPHHRRGGSGNWLAGRVVNV